MLRLVELGLFLTPFVVFIASRLLAFESGPPIRVVIGAACVLAVLAAALIWLSQNDSLPPNAAYAPARFQDGKVVAGHGVPR